MGVGLIICFAQGVFFFFFFFFAHRQRTGSLPLNRFGIITTNKLKWNMTRWPVLVFFQVFFFYLPARHMLLFLLHLFVQPTDGRWGEEGGREGGRRGRIRGDWKDKALHDGRCNCIRDNGAHYKSACFTASPPPHHPPLMESLPCLSRRRRKLAGSARRQPRPPGRLDPLIRSRRWKPEVGWSTDGGDPHPSSLHHHRVGEESGQNQDGGGGGRLDCRMDEDQSATIRPRCRGFTLSTT